MHPSNKKKSASVRDKLDGNAIDLSLLELTDVPVRELVQVTRGTRLDLSNNKLTTLSVAFPSLIHLVELDLSKNQLKELPVNFGDLKNLKKLDLYSNQLQRLPVSFYQLKELRWLDLKNNPLVSTLAEAAGDCLDQRGCQEAARKVVKLMTVVHEELEKKRLKRIVESRAELNRKNEEDRLRENQTRIEKKAEKDRKRAEAERIYKQQQQTIMGNNKSETNNTNTGKNVPNVKISKKNQKQRQQQVKSFQGPSYCMNLFVILTRLLIIATLIFAVAFGLNWKGPLTLDNAGTVASRTVNQISRHSREAYDWALPRLEPVREQWEHLSRFVADNGRNLLHLAWGKMVHYSKVVHEQVLVMWPVIQERSAEAFSMAAKYWRLICREVPIYYEAIVNKVMQLYQVATQTQNTKGT